MITFEGSTADEVWQLIAAEFRDGKRGAKQTSRCGPTTELLHVCLTVRDPQQHWVVSRTPAMNPAFAIAEIVWIMAGRNDSAFPNYWNRRLPNYAGDGDTYHGAYGSRLRRHFKVDQLQRAYEALRANSESRQVVLELWDPAADLPDTAGQPADPDIPCNICSMLKLRGGRLEWCQVVRSNDVFLGLPHNFVQFMSLHEIMAGWVGADVGTYSLLSDSLHLYDEHATDVAQSVSVDAPNNADSLCLPKDQSEAAFAELARRMDLMREPSLDELELHELVDLSDHPVVFRNMLLIVGADCARRRGWAAAVEQISSECSNLLLTRMWQRWLQRKAEERDRHMTQRRGP